MISPKNQTAMQKTKYTFLLLFILTTSAYRSTAQCPVDTFLRFTMQAEIDAFLVEYPECTDYQGDVRIDNIFVTDISNLQGLQNLTSIGGNFWFNNNYTLTSFSGLENLTSIGGYFTFWDNSGLTNFSGLENLTSIGGSFDIWDNGNLTSFSGLENLISIGGALSIYDNNTLSSLSGLENLTYIGGGLSCGYNAVLSNMSGLDNLTSIGSFYINNNVALSNMNGLNNLTSIEGPFKINHNDALSSMNGLDNLTFIGGEFSFYANDALSSMSGLENLAYIGGNFRVDYNAALSSLSGLESLTSIGGSFILLDNFTLSSISSLENLTSIGEELRISYNEELSSLSGLENLTSIGGNLRIGTNEALSSLSGLENLTSIGGGLYITHNPNLSLCNPLFICDYLVNGNATVDIFNNGNGCNSANEILFQCEDIGSISLFYYYDENVNAIHDNGEPYLSTMSATITPGAYTQFGNPNGASIKYLYYDDYVVAINEAPAWNLTSGNASYNISLDSINTSDTLYFGFIPNTLISYLFTTCVNGLPRCNEFVLFEPMIINNGTTIADGILWFQTDENILDVNFIDVPDTIVGSNKYGWFFTGLYPQQVFKKNIALQLPGPPDFPIGDEINMIISAQYADQINSEAFIIDNVHRVEILCSYDPNDKLVQSTNPYNYTLFGEDLIYTIRFQNTGNAEAYDVVIKDLLSEDLDLSTFRLIASSHDTVLNTYLDERMLTFEFRDIFLPDSTTNFDESQGYVMYSIRALDTLADFTEIKNTANIFFDYNPAVVTNTTENVMVNSFDMDGDGFVLWVDCDDLEASINPGAIEMVYNGIDEDCNATTLDDDLDQDGFVLTDDCDDNPATGGIINPNALEIPYNGIDEDCNATTPDDDLDQDGFIVMIILLQAGL
jgi:uncharacterized repeat protein (TIGR01451 family)